MSQAFSLYSELTVRQNIELHARLYHLPRDKIPGRINELIARFNVKEHENDLSTGLPLGIRQRLSLAVAVIHGPEILILDEPTSGVDPVARDGFWELLIDLSRNQGVTIFVSTHFMNEAERCDRISLMHAGRVLASDTPAALMQASEAKTLEEAFIGYLEEAEGVAPKTRTAATEPAPAAAPAAIARGPAPTSAFSFRRAWAYARREAIEIRRDPIRLAFALLGPLILMVVFGYGISFDVEHLPYAVLDRDQTPESRAYFESYAGSRNFELRPPIRDAAELERRMRNGELKLAIEIPSDFGKDLKRSRQPEVGAWVDGGMPFRAESSRGYVQGAHLTYLAESARGVFGGELKVLPVNIETRFRYNQDFKSVFAMVPGVIMLLLMLIPAMMTAIGVVREKELGSITNLYATPVTRLEFLTGKQLPYVAVAFASFLSLVLLALCLFQVPLKGGFFPLAGGALLYVTASTGFGLLVSTLVRTQIAALFAAAVLSLMPTINFSGMLTPVSSLSAGGRLMGYGFPSAHFQKISIGSFTKALGFSELWIHYLALAGFTVGFLLLALVLLKTQEI
jgi:ribosome-dependent ATPase